MAVGGVVVVVVMVVGVGDAGSEVTVEGSLRVCDSGATIVDNSGGGGGLSGPEWWAPGLDMGLVERHERLAGAFPQRAVMFEAILASVDDALRTTGRHRAPGQASREEWGRYGQETKV
jgi:hypothetical protein